LVAWIYSQYGIESFKAADIQHLAAETGLTIPGRVDMTLESMRREGKKLVQKTDRGTYRVTVHGEIFFKEKYHVAKGTGKQPADS
jgi:predicted transcriptional regulator